jgi:Tol biopolymer transport system component
MAPAEGGASRPLATFQSETPSWDPAGRAIGITYGTWRRVVDDAHYPDIAQETGIIRVDPELPAATVSSVVHASVSEDQSLCWSPNGKWIAFHSHQDQSDDIWLRPASVGDSVPRRISFLGRGAEAGWPRWSADGKWLLFDGASRQTHRSALFVIGVNQETGAITQEAREIPVEGVDAEVSHAEWLPDSAHVVVIAKQAPGRHVIFTVARDGGSARVVHSFATEHDAPGLAVSPDGRDVAFIAPSSDGFFQVFRLPIAGGAPVTVTRDPSNKTQPAWSPDGRRIAFTVWSYDTQFWRRR